MRGKSSYENVLATGARVRPLWLLVGLLFAVQTASAQEALTLHEVSDRALQNSPELQVFQWRLRAVDGLRQSAALRPGVSLGMEAENLLGSGEFSGTDRAEYTLSLSSIIELGGKRPSRVAVAHSRYALAEVEREARALDVLGQVTQRFIAVLALQEKLQVSEEAMRLAEASWQTVKQRVERGAAPDAERLRAQAALTQARLRRLALEAELASRRMTLATLWGAETADFDTLAGDLYAFETAESFEVLYQRVVASPAVQVFATEERLRAAELELARSQSGSNVQWSLGVTRFDDSGDSALTAGVSIPLFSARRQQGEVKAAQAEREIAGYRKRSALLALRARLFEAWQTHQQAVVATRQVKDVILPALEEALTQTRAAYERGRYRYIDLVGAQRELLAARLAMIDAATTALLNQALIEQLTAEPLAAKAFDSPRGTVHPDATSVRGQSHSSNSGTTHVSN